MPLAPSLPRSLVILILVLIYLSLTAGSARSVSASSQRKAYELVYSSARSASASSQRKMHCRAVLILFLLTASIRQNITVRSTSSFLSLRGQRRSYVNTLSCGPHFHSLRSASRQYIALRPTSSPFDSLSFSLYSRSLSVHCRAVDIFSLQSLLFLSL